MSEMMDEIYYMMAEQVGQQCAHETEMKILMKRKCALIDEIMLRIGDGGEDLLAAVRLGAELVRPEADAAG